MLALDITNNVDRMQLDFPPLNFIKKMVKLVLTLLARFLLDYSVNIYQQVLKRSFKIFPADSDTHCQLDFHCCQNPTLFSQHFRSHLLNMVLLAIGSSSFMSCCRRFGLPPAGMMTSFEMKFCCLTPTGTTTSFEPGHLQIRHGACPLYVHGIDTKVLLMLICHPPVS